MKLLIATKNRGKINEITAALQDLPVEFVTLGTAPVDSHYTEVGHDFLANALLKANYYYEQLKIPTLAEDSGLSVDYLGGEPGVKSRRWPGYEATDEQLMNLLLEKLSGVPRYLRRAHFISAVTFIFDPKNIYTTEHKVSGHILEKPIEPVQPDIPWSSLFFIEDLGKAFSQLSEIEKNEVSHRGGALKKIKPFIIKHVRYA